MITKEIFEGIYSCDNYDMKNIAKTRFDGFFDAIAGVTGKAQSYFIREREYPGVRFDRLLKGRKSVLVYSHGLRENSRRVLGGIVNYANLNDVTINIEVVDDTIQNEEILDIPVRSTASRQESEYDLVLHVCTHVYELKIDSFTCIWIDGWANIIADEKDFEIAKAFERSYELFDSCFHDRVKNGILEMTQKEIDEFGNN
jgi:hypothetical protein